MKRLVICTDGTWNAADRAGSDGAGLTNVARLHALVAPADGQGIEQRKLYHEGVGTGSLKDKVLGGVAGYGLSRNVKDCYRWLAENYEHGDEVFLFGFSRGAHTARSLCGLIRNASVLRREHVARLDDAYDLYRSRATEKHPKAEKAIEFRKAHGYGEQPIAITCIGIWDSVGALGVPTSGPVGWYTRKRYGFHDVSLSSWVRHAFHALAIDERRKPFAPTLWEVKHADVLRPEWSQHVEQAWFAGVHSNVGGGYADARLSDVTLEWMLRRARSCGLALDEPKLTPDCLGTLYDSMSWYYKPFGEHRRPIGASRVDDGGAPLHTFEYVHASAAKRQASARPPYQPEHKWGGNGVYGARHLPPGRVPPCPPEDVA